MLNVSSLASSRLKVTAGVSSLAIALLSAGLPSAVLAQDTSDADAPDDAAIREIIVTGTLIHGQSATGQQVVSVSSEDISKLGASDTSQILASLPQDINFNDRPQVGGYGPYQTTNTPRLRYLGNGTAASAPTLTLLDGARLPGMGILQTSPDMDAIAPGAIRQLDVATDGGSATYGADAVGGVVNIITLNRFDGLKVNGHFGLADNYKQYDLGGTLGKTWGNGSVWVAYQYAHHDKISNSDRDYVRNLDYTGGAPYVGASYDCSPGNYSATVLTSFSPLTLTNFYFPIENGAPNFGSNTANRCDLSKYKSFFPSSTRHSVLAGLDVDLSDAITFDIKAFYTHRDSVVDDGPGTYEVTDPSAVFPVISAKFLGNLIPTFGEHTYAKTTLNTWAVVPRLTARLGGDWRMVAFFNAGEGSSRYIQRTVDATALSDAVVAGSFNPYTGLFAGTAAGQAAQEYQSNYRQFSSGKDVITNARGVFDGPLFDLPGGAVRAAIGGEWFHESFTQRNGNALLSELNTILPHVASRTVNSAFGELSVPVVGENNRFSGIYSLTLSAAARYDHYNDFGGTFNPKFGVDLKPVEWWTLRGTWGKSYQAPSLAASASAIPPGLVVIPAGIFGTYDGAPNTTGKSILLLYPGGGLDLKPQKATTWEVGTDFKPDFLPGLSISATYYKINFKNQIAFPPFFDSTFYTNYPDSYVINTTGTSLVANGGNQQALTSEIIRNYVGSAYNVAQFEQYINDPNNVYALENGLQQNLSTTKTSGIDFNVQYSHDTSFGSVFGGVAGNYLLTYTSMSSATGPVVGLNGNHAIRLRTSTTLGAKVGSLLGQVTWNRTGGFQLTPAASNDYQSRVGAFNVFNLAIQYNFSDGAGILGGTSLTLNVDNVFDQDPPAQRASNGYSGFTIGRMVQLGIEKKF